MQNLDIIVIEPGENKGAEIQSAIDLLALNGGGEIWLKSGFYNIETPMQLESGVSITGVRPNIRFTQNCPDLGFEFTGGSILRAVTAITDCFFANTDPDPIADGSGITVSLSNIGFKGFRKVLTAGARNHIGLGMSELRSLFVDGSGTAGSAVTELAFDLVNCQHVRMDHVKCYNVRRALRFASHHDNCQPGNSVVTDFYAYLDFSREPEYGVLLEAIDTGNTPSSLNLISFIRPQVNWFGQRLANSQTETKLFWLKGSESAPVFACEFHGLNAEGGVDCAIKLENTRSTHVSITSILSKVDKGICLRNASYSHLVSLIPNVSIDSDRASWPCQLSGFVTDQADLMPMGVYWDNAARSTVTQFDQTGRLLSHRENSGKLESTLLSVSEQVSTLTSSKTLTTTDAGVIEVQNTNPVSYTLPDSRTAEGALFRLVKTSNNNQPITIQAISGQSINGLPQNTEMVSPYDTLTLQAVADSWIITSRNIN